MVSDSYGLLFINEAKKLDSSLCTGRKFERVAECVIRGGDRKAPLLFLKALSEINNDETIKIRREVSEAMYMYLGARESDSLIEFVQNESMQSFQELFSELYGLVGLEQVKKQVRSLIDYNKIQSLRVKMGLKRSEKTMHMAFMGNPGTAKTTVARIVGKMYRSIGLLSKGHFIEAGRTDLIAEYQGQTAGKVQQLIERARGGVLFIDEAYSITENDKCDSYGRECLTELTKALEDYRDDLCVIVAGYTEPMKKFFNSNPGLRSRFNTFINFNDYTNEELKDIFCHILKKNDYIIETKALERVNETIRSMTAEHKEGFANGREMRNLFDKIAMRQAERLSGGKGELSKEQLMLIKEEDVPS